uniref:Uncharacterized protein n=1 Tax=Aegilops tauschii subsp. strangulata TaxID=200361 RepID=A0A453I0S4_AEGTS
RQESLGSISILLQPAPGPARPCALCRSSDLAPSSLAAPHPEHLLFVTSSSAPHHRLPWPLSPPPPRHGPSQAPSVSLPRLLPPACPAGRVCARVQLLPLAPPSATPSPAPVLPCICARGRGLLVPIHGRLAGPAAPAPRLCSAFRLAAPTCLVLVALPHDPELAIWEAPCCQGLCLMLCRAAAVKSCLRPVSPCCRAPCLLCIHGASGAPCTTTSSSSCLHAPPITSRGRAFASPSMPLGHQFTKYTTGKTRTPNAKCNYKPEELGCAKFLYDPCTTTGIHQVRLHGPSSSSTDDSNCY